MFPPMRTYRVVAPLRTHWRPASCEDTDCAQWRDGWWSHCDEASDLGRNQAEYIRRRSGRRFTEHREDPDDAPAELRGRGLTWFWFPPGQQCFARRVHEWPEGREGKRHVVRNGRPEGYLADGRPHRRPEDWVEDFALNQDRVRTLVERG